MQRGYVIAFLLLGLSALVFSETIKNPCAELQPLPWDLGHLPSYNITRSQHFQGTFRANFTRPLDRQPTMRFTVDRDSILRFYMAATEDDIDISVVNEETNTRVVCIIYDCGVGYMHLFPRYLYFYNYAKERLMSLGLPYAIFCTIGT